MTIDMENTLKLLFIHKSVDLGREQEISVKFQNFKKKMRKIAPIGLTLGECAAVRVKKVATTEIQNKKVTHKDLEDREGITKGEIPDLNLLGKCEGTDWKGGDGMTIVRP